MQRHYRCLLEIRKKILAEGHEQMNRKQCKHYTHLLKHCLFGSSTAYFLVTAKHLIFIQYIARTKIISKVHIFIVYSRPERKSVITDIYIQKFG